MKKIAYEQMYKNELAHPWYSQTRSAMLYFLSSYLNSNSKILDVGCGTGGTIVYLKKSGFKNIHGIDSSRIALSFCKKRGLTNIKLSKAEKLPYDSNIFDAVICLDVLYHQNIKAKKVVEEVRRVLKPYGIFYSQEPAYNWLKSRHDIAIETGKRFTGNEIKNLLLKSRFKIIKITYFNAILLPAILVKRYKDKVYPGKSDTSDVYKLPLVVEKCLNATLTLERLLIKIANLPFGLSIISLAKKK